MAILLYGVFGPFVVNLIMIKGYFDWDPNKDLENRKKHGVSFADAQYAFVDPLRVIAEDVSHSNKEMRYYCFGRVHGGILTVRFTFATT